LLLLLSLSSFTSQLNIFKSFVVYMESEIFTSKCITHPPVHQDKW
jgi:hypothetical protein